MFVRLVIKSLLISAVSTVALSSCGKKQDQTYEDAASGSLVEPMLESLAPADRVDAAAVFVDRNGAEAGYAVITEAPGNGVIFRFDLKDIPQGWHAIHLHQVGDCSDGADGFLASAGHVDPDQNAHGLLNPQGPERADMPNIYAGADGRATAEIFNDKVSLYPSEAGAAEFGPFPLIDEDGFAIVLHEGADDHISQPIGGAGARIACAAIGSQKDES